MVAAVRTVFLKVMPTLLIPALYPPRAGRHPLHRPARLPPAALYLQSVVAVVLRPAWLLLIANTLLVVNGTPGLPVQSELKITVVVPLIPGM